MRTTQPYESVRSFWRLQCLHPRWVCVHRTRASFSHIAGATRGFFSPSTELCPAHYIRARRRSGRCCRAASTRSLSIDLRTVRAQAEMMLSRSNVSMEVAPYIAIWATLGVEGQCSVRSLLRTKSACLCVPSCSVSTYICCGDSNRVLKSACELSLLCLGCVLQSALGHCLTAFDICLVCDDAFWECR